MRSIVYQYGSPYKGPVRNELAIGQLFMENGFWNALVEVDHEFSDQYDAICIEASPELAQMEVEFKDLENRVEILRSRIKAIRSRKAMSTESMTDKSEIAHCMESIKQARENEKKLYEPMKVLRKKARLFASDKLHALEAARKAKVKALRQEYAAKGLYWGSYNAVLQGFDAARSLAMKAGNSLQFHPFRRVGLWSAQVIGGITCDEAFACSHGMFQIDPVSSDAWYHPMRAERRRASRTKARIRIGSNEDRTPRWLEIPIVMHRPMAPGAQIKSVSIKCRKVGRTHRWSLNIQCSIPDPVTPKLANNAIALDVGWKRTGIDVIRSGYMVDSDGREQSVNLDVSFIQTEIRLANLQGIQKQNFNLAKEKLQEWLKHHTEIIPEWMQEQVKELHLWKSALRLARLVVMWGDNRFDGDCEIFDPLHAWRWQDHHIYEWQSNLREKMQGRRREQYRVLSALLAEQYDQLIISNLTLPEVSRRKSAEEGAESGNEIRQMARLASPGELRECMKVAFLRRGKLVETVETKGLAHECPECGANLEPISGQFVVACPKCSKTLDIDAIACKNMLRRFAEGKVIRKPDRSGQKSRAERFSEAKRRQGSRNSAETVNDAVGM